MEKFLINIICEDVIHEAVIKKILDSTELFEVDSPYVEGKRSNIQEKIIKYNMSAEENNFFCLVDLDFDKCAPSLIKEWFDGFDKNPRLIFRVAVPEVESWLIADTKNFARFF